MKPRNQRWIRAQTAVIRLVPAGGICSLALRGLILIDVFGLIEQHQMVRIVIGRTRWIHLLQYNTEIKSDQQIALTTNPP